MSEAEQIKTDWRKCCLCQQEKSEPLISPPTKYQKEQDGYMNIAENVPLFHEINALPIPLDPRRLDEGGGVEETLRKNKAKYHKDCRLLFSNYKLERARNQKLGKDKKKRGTTGEDGPKSCKIPRSCPNFSVCFLCEEEKSTSTLRQVMTMKLSYRLKEVAMTLNDGKLLSRLSAGDAIAQELKYHPDCLAKLYNKERAHWRKLSRERDGNEMETYAYPTAFSELVAYITETKAMSSEGSATVFQLSELAKLYKRRLEQLGIEDPEINTTRLKEKLMTQLPELEAYQKGKNVFLAFHDDVGTALYKATKDLESEAILLTKAAKILRQYILDKKTKFTGHFEKSGIEEYIPNAVLHFISMVEHGTDIESQANYGASKTDYAISQLLQYNCFARQKEDAAHHRHSKEREVPFPIYMGLSMFSKTRKRNLVELLHEHGLCISYDRVLEISAQLGEAVVTQYVQEGVVCPPVLRKGLFCTSAMDNIDHNPTATTASTSFHGTSISIFQHPMSNNKGEQRDAIMVTNERVKIVPELPDAYTNVKPAHFTQKNPCPSVTPPGISLPSSSLGPFQEMKWLEEVSVTEEVDKMMNLTWSAYHASKKRKTEFEVSIGALLPLLRDQAHSVPTVKHVLDKVAEVVSILNPGQTPIVTADQPIYALAKQVQWQWPNEYGEDKFLIMFGGLHIEMAALRSIGTLLQSSGWTTALAEAGVTSSGTADSFLSVASVTKTRYAHQVTACSLFKLMKASYEDYRQQTGNLIEYEDWCDKQRQESPQFQYWSLILNMELTILSLVRSFREGDFNLYCESLTALLPYFFANNNINYARWLPVHLRDMLSLEQRHPQIAAEFQQGNFVVCKSQRAFSALAIDQAHEQANATIKGDGGAIGVTEDASALRRWMVAGPEVSRLVAQYEDMTGTKETAVCTKHHEETMRMQKQFFDNVSRMTSTIKELGNPFQEETADLISLDSKDIAPKDAAELVKGHLERGEEQFKQFMAVLESEDRTELYKPMKRNKTSFFKEEKSSTNVKQKALKEDCRLFSQLFISCQSRECDLKEFFQHENQSAPAALSDNGKLHFSQKSQLIDVLVSKIETTDQEPEADVIIIDGAALINALRPRNTKTFEEYASEEFLTCLQRYAAKYKRTDIVFDVYLPGSLKSDTRDRRGHGVRKKITATTKTPQNWQSFMRNDDNKSGLFCFLAEKVVGVAGPSIVVATKGENIVSNQQIDPSLLTACTHEEADTRVFLHTRHALLTGHKRIVIKANDTDVVVIAVGILETLLEFGLEELWIMFGHGQNLRWIPVHDMASAIGPTKASGILFYHAFTGCDVTSAFRGKGKKSTWQAWDVCPQVSEVFSSLSRYSPTITEEDIQLLEKYVITLYDKSSETTSVDDARLDLFARKQKPYENIPPTRSALVQHTKRAAYQVNILHNIFHSFQSLFKYWGVYRV